MFQALPLKFCGEVPKADSESELPVGLSLTLYTYMTFLGLQYLGPGSLFGLVCLCFFSWLTGPMQNLPLAVFYNMIFPQECIPGLMCALFWFGMRSGFRFECMHMLASSF